MSGRWRWLAIGACFVAVVGACDGDPIVSGDSSAPMDRPMDVPPSCDGGTVACGAVCVDTQRDPAHCGACGRACGEGLVCTAGTCQVRCPTGQVECGGQCVNTQTDLAHCGACGRSCPSGQLCSRGTCGLTCDSTLATCTAPGGDAGTVTYCADTRNDRLNCGACGAACPAGNICVAGRCQLTCATGQTDCAGACRDLQTDNAHCGACGRACPAGTVCSAGACSVSCGVGLALCGETCANLQTDNANCGACGRACTAGTVCSGGTCGTTCAPPLVTCGTAPALSCADTTLDPANCGGCGRVCALANVARGGCTDGACSVVRCAVGYGDCDGMASNGCETGTRTSAAHCGACGRACVLPNATTSCAEGTCTITACQAGFADCNRDPADGCEVNTGTDNANCGGCGTACAAGTVCSRGVCGTTCAAPLVTCGSAPAAYCADTAVDPDDCGGCGRACALPNVATSGCSASRCTVVRCGAGYGDCDGTAANGCETDLGTELASCGACGRSCAPPNATGRCAAGACEVSACAAGYADCNRNPADGCEVNTGTDNANCGACGTACAAGTVCSSGTCGTTCAAPLLRCGTAPATFCANTAFDPANCGACGRVCTLPGVATNGCVAGACSVVLCTPGAGDCDGTAANGCETNTQTSPSHCGACGRTCALPNAGAVCTGGACAVGTCAAGYADCNRDPTDGCEVNTGTDNANCGACGTACAAGTVCSGGTCGTTCAAPLVTCGTAPATFCASTANDPAHCGACGNACALPNAAAVGCADGACTVVRCNAGYGDCDGAAGNGCEADLRSSGTNCGACGRACALPGATGACASGACAVAACQAGYADCNRVAADGCEVNTSTDNANCGGCGVGCAPGSVCSGGACGTTCASPLATCGSGSTAYCANTAVDPANCGACGRVCALASTDVEGCAGGACTVTRCAAGYGDCDGTASNGCEAALGTDEANCGACGRACVGGQVCASGACACPSGQTLCGGACVDTQRNASHCGACESVCALNNASAACTAGACVVTACGTGYADCDRVAANGCEVNTQVDGDHCGACGMTCAAGAVCSRGACGATCASPLVTCGSGSTAYCANTAVDPANCGACGRVCALASTDVEGCAGGSCTVTRCAAGYGDCDGTAANGCEVNLQTSGTHCGACGHGCALANASATCASGACAVTACAAGYADCDHAAANGCEVNTGTDNANCGACGTTCPDGSVCSGGACGTTCAAPLRACGSGTATFCANTSNDPANCGGCAVACALDNVAVNACAAGACAVGRCNAGFGDCDGVASNGCETDLRVTSTSCGACGRACVLPNATAGCAGGACGITACAAGYSDCNHSAADGCEVNTRSDNANCGACGTTCGAGTVCSGGACTASCGSGLEACGGVCTSTNFDPANCGGCMVSCPTAANASPVCALGSCRYVCASGYGDCNGRASDGCESPLNTATACGACGNVCPVRTNATATCTSGACGFTCNAGYSDCDGDATNGCEVNTQTSTSHCGGCSRPCSLPNATAACASGTCAVATCNSGYGDCDLNPTNGCEVNTLTSPSHCGGCARPCASGLTCSAGTCVGTGTFVGTVDVGNLYMTSDPFSTHNARCNTAFSGSHQCTYSEVTTNSLQATICARSVGYIIVNDMSLARYSSGYGWYYYYCYSCGGGTWGAICNGQLVPCCR